MGGCRCNFRQCHVTTARYPRMHFFGFPLKEPERLKKWMQYSRMNENTEVITKNTVACARHFRVECFMNYKMDKLVRHAVPTLIRLSKDQALDFELDIEKGVLVTLEKTKFVHLLPPDDFESPLYLENDKISMCMLNKIIKETIQSSASAIKRTRNPSMDDVEKGIVDSICGKKFKILNSAHCAMIKENKKETTVALTTRAEQKGTNSVIRSDNKEFVDSNNAQKQSEYPLTSIKTEYNEDLEFLEIYKDDNESLHALDTYDSDSTNQLILKTPKKSPSNSAENLENIQIASSSFKRSREYGIDETEERIVGTISIRKFEILNSAHCSKLNENQNETAVQSKSRPDQNDAIHFSSDNIRIVSSNDSPEKSTELLAFIKSESNEEDLEFLELQKDNIESLHELETIQHNNIQKDKEIERFQLKISLLENENSQLKKICKETNELRREIVHLETENNHLKNILKEHKALKEKIAKYSEENRKLKEDNKSIAFLKLELCSRVQEIADLKEIVETFKTEKSNKIKFKEN